MQEILKMISEMLIMFAVLCVVFAMTLSDPSEVTKVVIAGVISAVVGMIALFFHNE